MTSHKLDRDGVSIHYEIHGEATDRLPVLLTHGYSASTAMWAPNLVELSADRQVVAWDMRGHGQTDSPDDQAQYSEQLTVEDMAALLDQCGVERAVIGGLSLGGYMSLAFHATHPERVAALLLFDTGPGYKNDGARDRWNAQAESRAQALEQRGSEALSKSPEVAAAQHSPLGLAKAARGMLAQRDARVITSLPSVRVPTLVVVGDRDEPYFAGTDYMAAKIDGAVKVVIPDAGHASNIDQPDLFNRAVRDFLAEAG